MELFDVVFVKSVEVNLLTLLGEQCWKKSPAFGRRGGSGSIVVVGMLAKLVWAVKESLEWRRHDWQLTKLKRRLSWLIGLQIYEERQERLVSYRTQLPLTKFSEEWFHKLF